MNNEHNPQNLSRRADHHVLLLLLAALALTTTTHAQSPSTIPVPTQFASAQSAFLGCAGAPALGYKEKVGANIIYESMYRALAAQKQYQLTATPASAELTMEVTIVLTTTGVSSDSSNAASLQLTIRDQKTHSILWVLDEPVQGAFREKSFQHNVDNATAQIIDDLKLLAGGKEPQP